MQLAIAAHFRWLGNDNGRQQFAARLHLAGGHDGRLAVALADNLEAMQPIGATVVHIRHLERNGVFVGIIPVVRNLNVLMRQNFTIGRVTTVLDAVELDGEERQCARIIKPFGKFPVILDAYFPARFHQLAILARPVEIYPIRRAIGLHRAHQLREMPLRRRQAFIRPRAARGAGPFAQADANRGVAVAAGDVGIIEAPRLRIIHIHVAGGGCLRLLPNIAQAIRVVGAVVRRVRVLNAIPHLAHRRVRANHHAIFRTRQRIAIVCRPLNVALRRFRIEIERLLEGIKHRRAVAAIQERAHGDEMEAVLQPVGRPTVVVVVFVIRLGLQVLRICVPLAQHNMLLVDGIGTARPDNLPVRPAAIGTLPAGRTDLIAQNGAVGRFRKLELPPVRAASRAGVGPDTVNSLGCPESPGAARPFGPIGSVRGVVEARHRAALLRRLGIHDNRGRRQIILIGHTARRRGDSRLGNPNVIEVIVAIAAGPGGIIPEPDFAHRSGQREVEQVGPIQGNGHVGGTGKFNVSRLRGIAPANAGICSRSALMEAIVAVALIKSQSQQVIVADVPQLPTNACAGFIHAAILVVEPDALIHRYILGERTNVVGRPAAVGPQSEGIAPQRRSGLSPGVEVSGIAGSREIGGIGCSVSHRAENIGNAAPASACFNIRHRQRIMINPRQFAMDGAVVIYHRRREIGGVALTDGHLIAGRSRSANLAIDRVGGGKLFGPDALHKIDILEAEIHVVGKSGRIVTRIAAGMVRPVEVHAAIQPHQHVVSRTIHARRKDNVAALGNPRQSLAIAIRRGLHAFGITPVEMAIGVELGVTVGPVLALHGNRVRQSAIVINRDDTAGPQTAGIGVFDAPNRIAVRRLVHVVDVRGIDIIRARPAVLEITRIRLGVVVQIDVVWIRPFGGDGQPILPARVENHQHRIRRKGTPALPGNRSPVPMRAITDVVIASEVFMDFQEFGDVGLPPLAQERGVGPARKGTAALSERLGVMIAIRIEQPQSAPQKIIGMVRFLAIHEIIVMALRMHHADVGGKTARARIVKSPQVVGAEAPVQFVAQVVIHQTHAGGDIAVVAGRLAQMFAKKNCIVPRYFRIEIAVAMVVPIAEAARHVELPLNVPAIAQMARIRAKLPEEIVRHVLHRIQTQTIRPGTVHQPARRPHQIPAHILRIKRRILRNQLRRDAIIRAKTHIHITARSARPIPRIAILRRLVRVRHPVVELRMIRVAYKRRLGMPVAFLRPVVLVGTLVGNVNQV